MIKIIWLYCAVYIISCD